MGKTKIEWATHVWNPISGCTPVSEGCENCYARRMAYRLRGRCGYPQDEPFKVTLHEERILEPYYWHKPRRIFVCSMSDLFHPEIPDEFIYRVLLTMQQNPRHTFFLLSKRPERILRWNNLQKPWNSEEWPQNIWVGVTAENQKRADERIPILLQIPAAVRFVSCEPLLGHINLSKWLGTCAACGAPATQCGPVLWQKGQKCCPECTHDGVHLDLVIVGGETGPGARPMCPDWVRDLRDQCISAEVPFFFKSWGDWAPWYGDEDDGCPGDPECEEINCSGCRKAHFWRFTGGGPAGYEPRDVLYSVRVGKKAAGRILDGQEWNQLPNKL